MPLAQREWYIFFSLAHWGQVGDSHCNGLKPWAVIVRLRRINCCAWTLIVVDCSPIVVLGMFSDKLPDDRTLEILYIHNANAQWNTKQHRHVFTSYYMRLRTQYRGMLNTKPHSATTRWLMIRGCLGLKRRSVRPTTNNYIWPHPTSNLKLQSFIFIGPRSDHSLP